MLKTRYCLPCDTNYIFLFSSRQVKQKPETNISGFCVATASNPATVRGCEEIYHFLDLHNYITTELPKLQVNKKSFHPLRNKQPLLFAMRMFKLCYVQNKFLTCFGKIGKQLHFFINQNLWICL